MEDKESAVLAAFQELSDSADVLRLFARASGLGNLVLGVWAPRVAQQFIKSTAVLQRIGNFPCVVVNEALTREIIRHSLLHAGVTVELYERRGSQLTCAKRGTPGNTTDFEAMLFEFDDAELQLLATGALTVAAEKNGSVRLGVASINATLRCIHVAEFTDGGPLSHLDAVVSQFSIKELLVAQDSLKGELERSLKSLCERASVTLTFVSPKEFVDSGLCQRRLQMVLRVPEEKMVLMHMPLATGALSCALRQVAPGDDSNANAYFIKPIQPMSLVRLDSAAIQALHLITVGGPEASKGKLPTSIYGWLNRCVTGMGSRTLRQWILQPLRSVAVINSRLDTV